MCTHRTGKKTKPKGEGLRADGTQLLTLEEHGLAEVTPHVAAHTYLDPEQVKAVGETANGGFLQVRKGQE